MKTANVNKLNQLLKRTRIRQTKKRKKRRINPRTRKKSQKQKRRKLATWMRAATGLLMTQVSNTALLSASPTAATPGRAAARNSTTPTTHQTTPSTPTTSTPNLASC